MRIIKRRLFLCLAIIFLLPMTSLAVPFLQLDIGGGDYSNATESIYTGATSFDLYAFAKPGGEIIDEEGNTQTNKLTIEQIIAETFLVSIAITGDGIDENTDVGSFTFAGQTISNGGANALIYGNPPTDATANPILGPHDIFPTLYFEYEFNFEELKVTDTYNTADNPGADLTNDPNIPDMLFQNFAVNTAGLYDDFELHFDLYSLAYKENRDVYTRGDFAPFSHDAETAPVPEPSTLVLLGAGLLGLAAYRRKKS